MQNPRAVGSLYFLWASNNHSIMPDRAVHHCQCLHTGRGLIFSAVVLLCFCWKRLLFVEMVGWDLAFHGWKPRPRAWQCSLLLGHRPGRRSLEAAAPPFWKSVVAASRGGRRSAHPSQRGLPLLGLARNSAASTWPGFNCLGFL